MSEDAFDIDYLSRLARLELTEAEKELFSAQLGSVMDFMKKLDSVDTEGVEPTAHAHPVYNVLGDDVANTPLSQEAALMNAPARRRGQVVVPKVVDGA